MQTLLIGADCTDGDACTSGDTCDAKGKCAAGTPQQCKAGTCESTSTCGNKKIDAGETCDDGNIIDGDGCSGTCQRECKTSGRQVLTFAGNASGFKDGKGTAASFKAPHGLDFDSKGNLYVADRDNFRVRRVASDGTVSTSSLAR